MSATQDDGATLRDHLMAVQRRLGRPHPMLADAPPCPAGCEMLWRDFMALHATRGGGFGPSRLSYVEIDAFQRVRGIRFEPWELEAIRRADVAWLAEHAKGTKKPGQG